MGRVLRAVRRVARRVDAGERGAALVEAAIVLPVILVIVFGAIEYGFLFKDASTLSGAARSGARIASAEPKDPNMASDAATAVATAIGTFPHGASDPTPDIWVYLAGNNGYPLNATSFAGGCNSDCVEYRPTWVGPPTNAFVLPALPSGGSGIPAADVHVCPSDSAAIWSRVGVYVKAGHTRVLGSLIPTPDHVADHAVFRLEPVPSSKCS